MSDVAYVRSLLVRAVEEKGKDYVYEPPVRACLYNHEDGPGCIVGHVFAYAGVEMPESQEGRLANHVVRNLTEWEPLVGEALRLAQVVQDGGGTWGEALQEFDNHVREVG